MRKPPKSAQPLLPGYNSFAMERELAQQAEEKRWRELWAMPIRDQKLFTARCLICCGLPVREDKTNSMDPVVRRAQIGPDTWIQVSYSRRRKDVPLPFGADRSMMYFLTDKAVLQQHNVLKWEFANEYMRRFGMNPESGKNYREIQLRFTRLAYMNIMVEEINREQKVLTMYSCPLIDNVRLGIEVDGEGNWRPTTSVAAMLKAEQSISVGMRFFHDLIENPVPIPDALILAADKQYKILDFMVFLNWRAWAGQTKSFIPWRYLREQFDGRDTNDYRLAYNFERAFHIMKGLPDPLNSIRAEFNVSGMTIYPYPVGTSFTEGHGKLGAKPMLLTGSSEEK